MSYKYEDYIRCKDILEVIKNNYILPENTDINSGSEELLLFIRNQNILRGLTDCQYLIDIEINKLRKDGNSGDNILINYIKTYINANAPIYIPNEIEGNKIRYELKNGFNINYILEVDDGRIFLYNEDVPNRHIYGITIDLFNKCPHVLYNDIILILYNLCNKYECNPIENKDEKNIQLKYIKEIWDFINTQTNVAEKIKTKIDFASGTLGFKNGDRYLYVGVDMNDSDIVIVDANKDYKILVTLSFDVYEYNKERFYEDLYTILSLNFGDILNVGEDK